MVNFKQILKLENEIIQKKELFLTNYFHIYLNLTVQFLIENILISQTICRKVNIMNLRKQHAGKTRQTPEKGPCKYTFLNIFRYL